MKKQQHLGLNLIINLNKEIQEIFIQYTSFLQLLPPSPLKTYVCRPEFYSVHHLSFHYQVLLETGVGQNDEVGEGLRCADYHFDWNQVHSLLLVDSTYTCSMTDNIMISLLPLGVLDFY